MVCSSKDFSSKLNEPHAFELTWKNYLPSTSQLACCFQRQSIQLEDDDCEIQGAAIYNDYWLYKQEALHTYLNNSRDLALKGRSVYTELDKPPTEGTHNKNNHKVSKMNENEDLIDPMNNGKIHTHKSFRVKKSDTDLQLSSMVLPALNTCTNNSMEVLLNAFAPLKAKSDDECIKNIFKVQNDDELDSKSVSDIDSIVASEALEEYENTNRILNEAYRNEQINIPSLADNPPFTSEQHPFGYFLDQNVVINKEEQGPESVFAFGRKFFGV
ncbi:hypothetical protein BY458DRAFT_509236 [Sporodiniella umbellata]|nr:hypothetical protein BY458DRAFT_509236 [Sporodiniella umbellata]